MVFLLVSVEGYLKAAAELADKFVKHPGEGLSYEFGGEVEAYKFKKAANSYELVYSLAVLVDAVNLY